MNVELSPRQSATVAVAITAFSTGVILLVVFGLFLLSARFVAAFSSVFLPLFVAVILALVMRPVQQVFQERMRLPPGLPHLFSDDPAVSAQGLGGASTLSEGRHEEGRRLHRS